MASTSYGSIYLNYSRFNNLYRCSLSESRLSYRAVRYLFRPTLLDSRQFYGILFGNSRLSKSCLLKIFIVFYQQEIQCDPQKSKSGNTLADSAELLTSLLYKQIRKSMLNLRHFGLQINFIYLYKALQK